MNFQNTIIFFKKYDIFLKNMIQSAITQRNYG